MATHTLTLDTKEIVKLLSICNTALTSEKRTLKLLPYDSNARQFCYDSIADIGIFKEKLKRALWDSLTEGSKANDI